MAARSLTAAVGDLITNEGDEINAAAELMQHWIGRLGDAGRHEVVDRLDDDQNQKDPGGNYDRVSQPRRRTGR